MTVGWADLPFRYVKEFFLIPMPVQRRREIVELVGRLLHRHGSMRRLKLANAIAFCWALPPNRADAVVLRESPGVGDIAAAHVEPVRCHCRQSRELRWAA